MRKLRLDFLFTNAGPGELQDALKSFTRQFAGFAQDGDLRWRLHSPQTMQQRREPMILVQWITANRVRGKAGIAAFNFDHGALVLIAVQENVFAFADQAMK